MKKFTLFLVIFFTCFTYTKAFALEEAAVLKTYADIAEAKYTDSLTTAKTLHNAILTLVENPSPSSMAAARDAWMAARPPYQQTEVYRFGNAIVDDWEGKVNAWPLDEGLIDYVDASYGGPTDSNALAAANVVANASFTLSGKAIDATNITPDFLASTLHEADGIEANVATGYHAIEFLLWGQDLNGHGQGAGNRSHTDFNVGDRCTNGNCDRRGAYLVAASNLLVSDLEYMKSQWSENGDARSTIMTDEKAGLVAILTGMGSLSYGEQAGERMKLGLMLNDPEEEHDCFSDNTHNSHFYDGLGIQNVYHGTYQRVDGTVISGPSLSDLVKAKDASLDAAMTSHLAQTMTALGSLKSAADNGFYYDQMLAKDSIEGAILIMAGVNGLVAQTKVIEQVVTSLGLDNIAFEGSDSLDNPTSIFQ